MSFCLLRLCADITSVCHPWWLNRYTSWTGLTLGFMSCMWIGVKHVQSCSCPISFSIPEIPLSPNFSSPLVYVYCWLMDIFRFKLSMIHAISVALWSSYCRLFLRVIICANMLCLFSTTRWNAYLPSLIVPLAMIGLANSSLVRLSLASFFIFTSSILFKISLPSSEEISNDINKWVGLEEKLRRKLENPCELIGLSRHTGCLA